MYARRQPVADVAQVNGDLAEGWIADRNRSRLERPRRDCLTVSDRDVQRGRVERDVKRLVHDIRCVDLAPSAIRPPSSVGSTTGNPTAEPSDRVGGGIGSPVHESAIGIVVTATVDVDVPATEGATVICDSTVSTGVATESGCRLPCDQTIAAIPAARISTDAATARIRVRSAWRRSNCRRSDCPASTPSSAANSVSRSTMSERQANQSWAA